MELPQDILNCIIDMSFDVLTFEQIYKLCYISIYFKSNILTKLKRLRTWNDINKYINDNIILTCNRRDIEPIKEKKKFIKKIIKHISPNAYEKAYTNENLYLIMHSKYINDDIVKIFNYSIKEHFINYIKIDQNNIKLNMRGYLWCCFSYFGSRSSMKIYTNTLSFIFDYYIENKIDILSEFNISNISDCNKYDIDIITLCQIYPKILIQKSMKDIFDTYEHEKSFENKTYIYLN